MKTVFSSAKRCLALVLAVLLLIPVMAAPAFASTQETVTVSELLLSNYDSSLTEAEKEFLSHGLLADTTITFDVPTNDDELIKVNKDTKVITFQGFDDGNGNYWMPGNVEIVVNETVVETVQMTFDGVKATGTYEYDGNAFAVRLPLSLLAQVSEDTQQGLLDGMADLRAGYDAIQGLYLEDSNVGLFEDALSQEGGLVDAANNGIKTGLTAEELSVSYLSDEAVEVILALDAQMTENGGLIDLRQMLAEYAAGSATDYLLNGDVAGLLAAADELIENLGIIHTEMASKVDYLNGLIATLDGNTAMWPMMGVDQAQYDALVDCAANAETVASAVNSLKNHLNTAVAHSGWNVDLTGVLAEGVDYAHVDEHVIALGEGYVSTVTPVSTLYVDSTTLQHNMSMYNVTVELGLAVVISNEEVLYDVNTVVLTLMENATSEEIQAAIDASGIMAASMAEWTATGYFVPEHFGETTNGLPETLTEDYVYSLYYTPVRYTVDYDYQEDEDLKYGSTIVLPIHEDITKAYDYEVNGVDYAQGSIIMVDGNLTITRTEGRAYTNYSLYKLIDEQFGNGEYELLSVRALTVKDQNVAVRVPTNSDNLVTISGTSVTAGTFSSDYYGLIWNPVSVDVYVEGNAEPVETITMENGTAVITADNFDYVDVNYELALTNITAQQMVDVLNLAIDLKNEAAAQRECMAILADNLEYLQMLDKTMLSIIKSLAEEYCWPETVDAVVFLQNNCVNPATGKLYLTEYMEFYTSDNGGLWYYYQNGNWAKIKAEVDRMLPYMNQIKSDPGIKTAMEVGVGGQSYGDKYEAIPSLVDALNAANFTGPNEVINLQSSFLPEFIEALDNWVPAQTTHYAPEDIEGSLVLNTKLTKTSSTKAAVLINIELKDKFGVSTTATYGPVLFNAGVTLDDDHKQEILAGVKALVESIDPLYDDEYTYTFGIEGSDLETELMNALSAPLTDDLTLYYNWNEICWHDNYIPATCISPNLCEVCGQYFGEVNPDNHNWNEGVEYVDEVNGFNKVSCTEDGWTLYTCSWCNGEEIRNDIPATGHNWSEWQDVADDDDNHWRYCLNDCGSTECESHSWNEGVITTPATCETDGVLTYTCSVCGGQYTEVIPATGHSYTNYVSNGDATCTEDGTKTAVCDNGCGTTDTVADPGSALGHDFSGKCHDYGEAGHAYQCIRCDVIEEARRAHNYEGTNCAEVDHCTECNREKPAGEHAWGEWKDNGDGTHTRECTTGDCPATETADHTWGTGVVTTPATCTEDGVKTYTCTACGATKTEAIPATGHSYGEWSSDGDDTHSRVCATCGDVETAAHEWGDWTSDNDVDHTRSCSVCGETQTEEHVWDDGVVTTPATCEVPGVMTYTCTVCGRTHDTEIPATGHSFTNYVYNNDATCTEDGTSTAACDNGCGKTDTIAAPGTALGHDFTGEWVACGAEGHAHKCIRCDAVEEARYAHNFDNDACDETATCVDCSYLKPIGEHSWGEWVDNGDGTHTRVCTSCGDESQTAEHTWGTGVVTTPATCTEDGVMTYTCTGCGAVKTEAIPATGHDWGDWTCDDNAHSRTCSVCNETESQAHIWGEGVETKPATITETGVMTYTCSVCNHIKNVEIPVLKPEGGSHTGTNSKREVIVSLEGDQGSVRYDMLYTIVLDEYEIQVPVTNEMTYNFNLTTYFKEHYLSDFASEADMNTYLTAALRQNRIVVEIGYIDTYTNQLYDFVKALDKAANGALDFSLLNDNGNYSIVANVSNPAGAASSMMGIAQEFIFSGYSYFGIKTVNGFVPFFADFGDGSILLSLQALIDGLLCEDGFGTNTIIELAKGNAVSIPGSVVVDGGNIGGYLQKTQLQIGTDASSIQYTVDFYLTMNDMAQLDQVANALNSVKNYVTVETVNGELFVELTLPEKVYEVYLAMMLATGEVDKSDVNAIESAIAFRFLYDYLDLILTTGADTQTFENTLAMLGQSYDLSSYEAYYQTLKELLTTGSTDAMGGDVVANLDLNKDEAKGTLDLIANAKTLLNTLLAKAGMGNMETELNLLIKEYKYGEDLTVTAKAELSEAKPEFEVAVIDIRNGSTVNKADFATNGASRINSLAGEAAVVLLDDIVGNLVFNHITILDLNGHTITGTITANNTLIIVDSSMDSDDCGGVDGAISGNVIIIAGNYTYDVSGFLADGYTWNGSAVTNALYTIDVDAAGNVTFVINSDVMNEVADGYIPAVRELAVDIAVDLVLNYITAAALAVDGQDLYAIDLTDIVGLVKGEGKMEKVIDELLSYVKVDAGITNFINTVIDDLLDFETIADAIENDTSVATYTITTKPWMIHLDHNVAGDYIELGVTNNENLAKTFDLNLVITGDNAKTYLLPVIKEFAKIVTKKDVDVQLYQPQYDNKTLHNVGGTFGANFVVDMTDGYPVIMAIILAAYGTDMGDLNAVLAAYQNDPSCAVMLKDELDAVTVRDVVTALKGMNRSTSFAAMAKAAGVDTSVVDIDTAAKLEKLYHLVLCGAGKVLEYLEVVGGNRTLGGLDADNDGVYVADKYNVNRTGSYTHSSGYGVAYNVTVTELALSVRLFGSCDHTFGSDWKYDDTNHWHECVCGVKTDVAEHSFVWVDNNDGTHDQYCTVCGYINVDDEDHIYDNANDVDCNKCGHIRDLGPVVPPTPPTPPTPGHCLWCGKDHCPSAEFVDLSLTQWYHTEGYTDYVLCRGLMIGMVNTPESKVFAPELDTTRAMIVMTLYRIEQSLGNDVSVTGTSTYDDVKDTAWYAEAIIWATEKGIVEGYGNGKFGPNDYVTREQIDTIFYRYASWKGMDVSMSSDLSQFDPDDVAKISDWALDAVKWAVAVNLMEGRGHDDDDTNTLDPRDATTRAESAALLYRWCEELN